MKVVLMFAGFAVLSLLISAICALNGFQPWQVLLANVMAGAILGLVSGAMA